MIWGPHPWNPPLLGSCFEHGRRCTLATPRITWLHAMRRWQMCPSQKIRPLVTLLACGSHGQVPRKKLKCRLPREAVEPPQRDPQGLSLAARCQTRCDAIACAPRAQATPSPPHPRSPPPLSPLSHSQSEGGHEAGLEEPSGLPAAQRARAAAGEAAAAVTDVTRAALLHVCQLVGELSVALEATGART